MTVNETLPLVLAGLAGIGLGLFFFGGLWLTVRWLPGSRWPAALVLGSLLARMAITLAGFYLVMAGRWERLLACLAGFVVARFIIVARSRPEASNRLRSPKSGA